jgi:hypothetical protein
MRRTVGAARGPGRAPIAARRGALRQSTGEGLDLGRPDVHQTAALAEVGDRAGQVGSILVERLLSDAAAGAAGVAGEPSLDVRGEGDPGLGTVLAPRHIGGKLGPQPARLGQGAGGTLTLATIWVSEADDIAIPAAVDARMTGDGDESAGVAVSVHGGSPVGAGLRVSRREPQNVCAAQEKAAAISVAAQATVTDQLVDAPTAAAQEAGGFLGGHERGDGLRRRGFPSQVLQAIEQRAQVVIGQVRQGMHERCEIEHQVRAHTVRPARVRLSACIQRHDLGQAIAAAHGLPLSPG